MTSNLHVLIACASHVRQFVAFNSRASHPDELARELLAEIPSQLVSAFISRGILPKDPVAGALSVPPTSS